MTEEQRAELEKLARAAGAGDWRFGGSGYIVTGGDGADVQPIADFLANPEPDVWQAGPTLSEAVDRGRYVIAACNAVPDLLATIARLEAEAVKDGEALEKISEGGPDIGPVIGKSYAHGFDQGAAWSGRIARARLSSRAKDQSQ